MVHTFNFISFGSQVYWIFIVSLKVTFCKTFNGKKNKILSTQVCSVWLPVDPVSKHTCLRLVKGSHRSPHYFKPVHFDGPPFTLYEIKPGDEEKAEQFLPAPDIGGDEQFQVLSWDMEVISYYKSPVYSVPGNSSWYPAGICFFFFFSFNFLVHIAIRFCGVKRLRHLPVDITHCICN